MKAFIFLALLAAVTFSENLCAQNSLYTEIPSRFTFGQLTLGAMGVAEACLTMTNLNDSLPCQPAFLAKQKKGTFIAQLAFGDSYTGLQTADHILNKNIDSNFVSSLFQQNQVISMEANSELTFIGPHFAAQFVPYQITYFSVIRDEAYPVVALHALQARSWTGATGYDLTKELSLGLSASFVQRKFIQTSFDAFEAASESGSNLLSPQTQNAFFLSPGLVYQLHVPWRPRISILGRNIGFANQYFSALDDEPEVGVGFGVTPPLRWGKLEIGLDYEAVKDPTDTVNRLHLGASYQFGHMTILVGASQDDYSGGVMFGLDSIRAGIIYKSTNIPFGNETDYARSIYSEFGLQI
jgi:hypothetical protein